MLSTERIAGAGGLELFVRVLTPPQPKGPRVLMLHGFLDAGGSWDLVEPALLEAGLSLVVPDLRGFGASARIGTGGYYHFADYIADVARLVNRFGEGQPMAVVGHSMGGTIASYFTGARQEQVSKLVLMEGLGPPATEPSYAVDRMQSWLKELAAFRPGPILLQGPEDALLRLSRAHPTVPREVLASRVKHLTTAPPAGSPEGALAWAYDPLHRTTSPYPFNLLVFKEFLSRITCPVLAIGGGEAGWHPADERDRFAAIRNLRELSLEGAGHMMHWTRPKEVADAIAAFVLE